MQKLALHKEPMLQGEFSLKKLNFLFAFQVNCPGCFTFGIPLVSKLYEKFGNQISFLGLSTAFEDFELNTEQNTKLLLEERSMVGVTKEVFQRQGHEIYPLEIPFPVAFDKEADQEFDYQKASENISLTIPDYSIWPAFEQQEMRNRVTDYLNELERISMTFTLNQLKGTPSFIVFNDEMEILLHEFGHVDPKEISSLLQELVNRFN